MANRAKTRVKDGIAWPIGSQGDVEWLSDRTGDRHRITGAIPPVFAAYATVVHPGEPDTERDVRIERRQDLALLDVLRRHAAQLPWWLAYLDTGASDIVFWDAPKVMLYTGWRYLLVLAGPDQAATWRLGPNARRVSTEQHSLPPGHAAR
jgi:hypothetical protein